MRLKSALYLQNKRLFHKWTFLVVLLILPLFIWMIRGLSKDSASVFRVDYYSSQDIALVKSIVKGFDEYKDIIVFRRADSQEQAKLDVESGRCDAAWIFADDIEDKVKAMVEDRQLDSVVEIYQREDGLLLRLTREFLNDSIFPRVAYESYVDFVRHDLKISEKKISDQELSNLFDEYHFDDKMFEMGYVDGGKGEDSNYLLAPIRGIMAVWLTICSFLAQIYYMQDEKKGLYNLIPLRQRPAWAAALQSVLMVDCSIAFLVAIGIAGVFTNWRTELICLILYAIASLILANVVRILCGSHVDVLCASMAMIVIIMLVLSPVFISINAGVVNRLLPSNLYLRGIHSPLYRWNLLQYCGVMLLVLAVVSGLKPVLLRLYKKAL
ncbi:MAG TPA: hypothetical protein DCP96_02120 [Lachnospiraceae bacterium]|nr:hypothetical protein [Lachnospiraceae bacterium]HBE07606.1 hypothetical protein [Lachnospiraceae bacterium]